MTKEETNKTYHGHNIDIMKTFPDNCIDCIITSPPYYQLRDYKTEHQVWNGDEKCKHEFEKQFCIKCNAWKGELGQEPTYQMYIDNLISVFAECKRILKNDGTMFVNLGDTYNSVFGGMRDGNFGIKANSGIKNETLIQTKQKLKSKCLLNIPSRFRIAMTDILGLIQRNNIIWYKPNSMPQSVKDRFTVDFEDIMFFVKSKNYYFEQQFEKSIDPSRIKGRVFYKPKMLKEDAKHCSQAGNYKNGEYKTRLKKYPNKNMRAVWAINTAGTSHNHYAAYPETLIARMIKAGCRENGIVLDPFGGSGITGKTAMKLNRKYINIEINKKYIELSKRINISEHLNF